MAMSWLLNFMINEMGEYFMYYKTMKEIWDAVYRTYFNKINTSLIIEIKGILHHLGKEICQPIDYFNLLTHFLQQLDMFEELKWNARMKTGI